MNLNPDFKKLTPKIKNLLKHASSRATFGAIILVLLAYLFMVWRISSLSTAEPTPEAEGESITANTNIPRINKEAVDQIQSLEASNREIRSLFNRARNNPFEE